MHEPRQWLVTFRDREGLLIHAAVVASPSSIDAFAIEARRLKMSTCSKVSVEEIRGRAPR